MLQNRLKKFLSTSHKWLISGSKKQNFKAVDQTATQVSHDQSA